MNRIKVTLIGFLVALNALLLMGEVYSANASVSGGDIRFNHYLSSDKGITSFYKSDDGIVWIGTRDGIYEYLGENTFGTNVVFPGRSIEYLSQDSEDRIWACSGEVFIYNRRTGRTYLSTEVPELLGIDSLVTSFCRGASSEMWFSSGRNIYYHEKGVSKKVASTASNVVYMTTRGSIMYALCSTGEVLRFTRDINSDIKSLPTFYVPSASQDEFVMIFVDSKYNLWVSQGQAGVWIINPQGETVLLSSDSSVPGNRRLPSGYPDAIVEDKEGNVWLGLDHGGVVICQNGVPSAHLNSLEEDNSTLLSDSVNSLFSDEDGSVWVGYYKKGLSIYSPQASRWSVSESEDINTVCEDIDGNLYLGTDGEGLIRIDSRTGKKTVLTKTNSPLASDVITALKADSKGGVWIGTYLGGLSYFDGSVVKTYGSENGLASDNVWSIEIDPSGKVWAGLLSGGVQLFDSVTGKFVSITGLSNESIFQICSSPSGELYVATGYGLDIIDTNTHTVRDIIYPKNAYSNLFMGLLYDSRGLVWLNEDGHLQVLDSRTSNVYNPFIPKGTNIKGFAQDSDSNIWAICESSLVRYQVVPKHDGGYDFICNTLSFESLPNLQFNERSVGKEGEDFLIGSFEGYLRLSPSEYDFASKASALSIRLAALYIDKNEIPVGTKTLPVSLPYCDEIVLSHKDNNLSFSCEVISYSHEMRNPISYQMKGLSDEWVHFEAKTTLLEFPGLKPGHYTLTVKEDNVDTDPIVLRIVIRHPWYFSVWAYLTYLLLFIGLVFFTHWKLHQRKQREIEVIQREQQHTIDEMKMRFFTNISHDFRTTLTLILSPLEEMIAAKPELKDNQAITTIYRNATRLQTLVSQLLDIRKIDKQGIELVKVSSDIIPVLKECADSFKLYAEGLQMDYKFVSDTDSLVMDFDHDKLIKILTNLLSNAFKYTPKGGLVEVDVDTRDEDRIRISVIDSGCGVPEEEKSQIFQRFYQSSSSEVQKLYGTGIGLHIVSEFVHLHGGEIIVEDNDPKGSIFSFTLPIEHNKLEEGASSSSLASSSASSPFSVLIVDDNEDFRSFLRSSLSGDYNVFDADNGATALQILSEEKVDLVISDVMMPLMDGFELCRRIKSDVNISHIPVLLLTAKSMAEDEIEGLSCGADDYLTKPFNMSILRFRVAKFIEWKQRTQEHFQSDAEVTPEQSQKTSVDDAFIAEATRIVTENLTDPKFSVEMLAESMNMHRTSLYKKLDYITGKSPLEFIRTVRMKHAAVLLLDPKLYISEVAYQVGFNSPKVFAIHFKEEFGMSPTEYKKSHGGA